jgi:hypothetical protein
MLGLPPFDASGAKMCSVKSRPPRGLHGHLTIGRDDVGENWLSAEGPLAFIIGWFCNQNGVRAAECK